MNYLVDTDIVYEIGTRSISPVSKGTYACTSQKVPPLSAQIRIDLSRI